MTSEPQPTNPELLPDLVDLDVLLADVAPLASPHDWAAPDLIPDDVEFSEFLNWVRAERNRDVA